MTLNNKSMTRRLGLIALLITLILIPACTNSPQRYVKTVPKYEADFLEKVAVDGKACGPAAKKALYDWLVMIGG